MTRAALTKLVILVILAFIICLPEFFTLYKESKVNFHCQPYRPREPGKQVKAGKDGRIGHVDPSQTPEWEKWEQACAREDQSNATDPASDSRRGDEDPEKSCFMCETDTDMLALLRESTSSALKVQFEVSVELHLPDVVNLTLYSLNNHGSLHLRPPEEEDGKTKDGEGPRSEAFYCCLPSRLASASANQSRCLLWFSNRTVLTAAKETLPWKRTMKDEWSCMFRVLWLVLLCVVLLTIVIVVLGQIYWRGYSCRKPKVHPVCYDFSGQQLNDGEKHADVIHNGMILPSHGPQSWFELSTIHEVDSQENIETLLDGNVDHCYTANLHHRNHPFTSSCTEEQGW
ncbi:uncharacterized protein LOC104927669 isoform X1 [Larimichthys crocea]|uniref:uncharacterized protein LOC104927669 isoform X1 n=1 Tax=Larimichthys crocea TaxID=215358 RepID=UPI000F5DC5C2|nr:uncharacterized protein LOC104927669 isoform X1 [Larimichthys crocea]